MARLTSAATVASAVRFSHTSAISSAGSPVIRTEPMLPALDDHRQLAALDRRGDQRREPRRRGRAVIAGGVRAGLHRARRRPPGSAASRTVIRTCRAKRCRSGRFSRNRSAGVSRGIRLMVSRTSTSARFIDASISMRVEVLALMIVTPPATSAAISVDQDHGQQKLCADRAPYQHASDQSRQAGDGSVPPHAVDGRRASPGAQAGLDLCHDVRRRHRGHQPVPLPSTHPTVKLS